MLMTVPPDAAGSAHPCTRAAVFATVCTCGASANSADSVSLASLRVVRERLIRVSRESSASTSAKAVAGHLIATDCTTPRASWRSCTRVAAISRISFTFSSHPPRLDQAKTVASGIPSSRAAALGPIATTSTRTASLSIFRGGGITALSLSGAECQPFPQIAPSTMAYRGASRANPNCLCLERLSSFYYSQHLYT